VPGMAPWWRGWPHRADGDGGDAPDVTAWPLASAERASNSLRGYRRPLSRVRHAWPYKSGWHNVAELTPALPHSGRDGLTGRAGGTAPDMTPRRVRGTACTWGWRARRRLERGRPHLRGRPALERGRPHPRGRPALERGGISPEGATDPRARRSFASAALHPSSEAEFRPRVPGLIVLVGR
jgi:hypothetical protein